MASTDRAWNRWAESDPYYAVLTYDRFRSGHIDRHRDEFFATGEADIETILDRYARHFGPAPLRSALDFGCGVGRLAIALSRRFDRVLGLDIAPAMLSEGTSNAAKFGRDNIGFALSDDELTNAPGRFDFVNSLIVLQHIPIRRGMGIIARLLDRVEPGGGCLIHVAVQRNASLARRLAYFVRHSVPAGGALVNLAAGRSPFAPSMQMNEYSLPDLLELFARSGFPEVVCTTADHGGVQTVSLLSKRQ